MATAAGANAEVKQRLRGEYVYVDTGKPRPAATAPSSNIIFLNRCQGGCQITKVFDPYSNDSRQNRSSIPGGSSGSTWTVSEFRHGDAAWDQVLRCVRNIYEPYGVVVTDQDPGTTTEHYEAIVAGTYSEIGYHESAGVAPYTCDIINNAISFAFANLMNDPDEICWTVAQETAHAFGFDHELLCEDPMTYLTSCGPKKIFQDVDASCGENQVRPCYDVCWDFPNQPTQNSHQMLLDLFGAGGPTPPTVEFKRPLPNQKVQPSFPIEVIADDNVAVTNVKIFVGDRMIADLTAPPYIWNAPADQPEGPVTVRTVVTDNRNYTTEKSVQVTQGPPCFSDDECGGGFVCLGGNCIKGPTSPGGLGSVCASNEECDSSLCGVNGDEAYCTDDCQMGVCPSGFACQDAGGRQICWPSDEGGGCSAAPGQDGRGPLGLGFLLLFASALILRRRPAACR